MEAMCTNFQKYQKILSAKPLYAFFLWPIELMWSFEKVSYVLLKCFVYVLGNISLV
jgi:hypothetical protein